MTFDHRKPSQSRNLISFWIFGLCNNFAYSVMLSAAQDILNKHKEDVVFINETNTCLPVINNRHCSPTSAGVVLLCNILPALIVKLTCPFLLHRIPYGIRHFLICSTQALSLLVTAFADSVSIALCGVLLASFSSGLGETTYLGLAGHYSKNTIATWSSGTGMAGIVGAFSYAGLTDKRLLALSPSQAMLVMLFVPALFAFTYYVVLVHAPTIRSFNIYRPSEWFSPIGQTIQDSEKSIPSSASSDSGKGSEEKFASNHSLIEQMTIVKKLLRYMVPLLLVYFAEYLINQGLLELIVFDCAHSFDTSPTAQYRWYQVVYQVGVFVSRSSIRLVQLNMTLIALMPIFQLLNVVFFLSNAIFPLVPHLGILSIIILYEGLIGGGSYVNTFNHIHKKVDAEIREFALSTVSLADSMGILIAAIVAIPVHNSICEMRWHG